LQLGHAVGLRSLKPHHCDEVAFQRAAIESRHQFVLAVEDDRRRFHDMSVGAHRRYLDHRPPEVPSRPTVD